MLGANTVDILHVNWETVAGLSGGAALLSILTSLASLQLPPRGTASLVKTEQT
jgi:hypothetical protein